MGWLQTEGRGKLSGIGSSFIEGCPCFPTVIARYGARDRPLFQPGPILLLRSSLVRGLGSNIMLRGTMGCNVGTSYSEIQVLYSGLGNPLSVRGRAGTIPCRVYAVSMQSTRLGNPTPKLRCGEPCPYLHRYCFVMWFTSSRALASYPSRYRTLFVPKACPSFTPCRYG